jgi:hypothetical protein
MIDIPVQVYVEYKNLSNLSPQAEYQKDLISSVLKKLEGQSKIIMEYSSDDRESQKYQSAPFYYQVRCVVCYPKSWEGREIRINSVKKEISNQDHHSLVSFQTYDASGKVSVWKVDISKVKPILVHSGNEVTIHLNGKSGIEIRSTGVSLKNGARGDKIAVQIKDWFHEKKSSMGTNVIEAKVIGPNEVEYVSK